MPVEKNALTVTLEHIRRVNALMGGAAREIIRRGVVHDASKLQPEELAPLQALFEHQQDHGQAAYGTDAYEEQKAMLDPMLEHHYANNSHHPEHYADGVNGMDLFDVMEMFFDWKAASERGGEDTMNLTAAAARYNVSPQLLQIMQNTAQTQGFAHK
jgi:hypothetical protein